MTRRSAIGLGALACAIACTVPWYTETDRAYGVGLDAREAAAPAAIPEQIVACGRELDELVGEGQGGRLLDGARVRFAEDVELACPPRAAACYLPDADVAVVPPDGAALCHELKHRSRVVMGLAPDHGHDAPGWWDDPTTQPCGGT